MKFVFYRLLGISTLNPKAQRFISRAVALMYVYVFIIMMSNTFLILHALEFLSLYQLGLILAIQFSVQAIMDYPSGVIGDWVGHRWVLFLAAISYGSGFFLLAQAKDFIGILIAFIIIAFAQSQESGTFIAWLDNNYKLYASEDGQRRIYSLFFGNFTMFHQVITATSFILGGFAIVVFGRNLLFLIQGVLVGGLSAVFLIVMRDHKTLIRDDVVKTSYFKHLVGGLKTVAQNKTLRLLILGLVLSGVGFSIWSGLILFPLYWGYGKSDGGTAILRSTIFIFSAISTGLAGTISKRISRLQKWLAVAVLSTDVFFFLGILIMLEINPIPSLFSVTALLVVITTFTISFIPRYMADVLKPRFFLDVIPDQHRNSIYSLIPTLILLTSAVAAPIAGWLIEVIGLKAMILILAVNGLVGSSIAAYAIYNHTTKIRVTAEAAAECCPKFPTKMTDTQSVIPLTVPCCWPFESTTE
jgi:MFS family permease